jgi:MFS transporter, OFA family, oxalate/formate antiporter
MKKYYCWIVLFCLFLVYMASNGMILNTFTQYTPELMKFWKLDFKGASSFQSTIYFVLALPLPFVGWLLQRYSPRNIMVIGGLGIAVSLYFFANANSIGMMRIFTVLFPLFLSGVGLLTCMYLINNWFSQYRGIATGILLTGSSIGPAIFAPVLGGWIKTIGWQQAAQYEAIIGGILILVPALFVKNHPAEMGTWADGKVGHVNAMQKIDQAAAQVHFNKAVRSFNFYLVVIVTAVLWFCIGGLFVHHGLYLKELKFDAAKAGQISGIFFYASLLGKLFFGWISDKINVKQVMLLSVVNMLTGCVLLWLSVDNAALTIPYAILLGAGYSGTFTMIQLYVMRLYGGPGYGSILGLLSFVDTLCLALGGLLFAKLRMASTNYANPFLLMVALTAFSLLATVIINRRTEKSVY